MSGDLQTYLTDPAKLSLGKLAAKAMFESSTTRGLNH